MRRRCSVRPSDVRPARERSARDAYLVIAWCCLLTAVALIVVLVRAL